MWLTVRNSIRTFIAFIGEGMPYSQDQVLALSGDLAKLTIKQNAERSDHCFIRFSSSSVWAPKLEDLVSHYELLWILVRWSGPCIPRVYVLSAAIMLADDKCQGV